MTGKSITSVYPEFEIWNLGMHASQTASNCQRYIINSVCTFQVHTRTQRERKKDDNFFPKQTVVPCNRARPWTNETTSPSETEKQRNNVKICHLPRSNLSKVRRNTSVHIDTTFTYFAWTTLGTKIRCNPSFCGKSESCTRIVADLTHVHDVSNGINQFDVHAALV